MFDAQSRRKKGVAEEGRCWHHLRRREEETDSKEKVEESGAVNKGHGRACNSRLGFRSTSGLARSPVTGRDRTAIKDASCSKKEGCVCLLCPTAACCVTHAFAPAHEGRPLSESASRPPPSHPCPAQRSSCSLVLKQRRLLLRNPGEPLWASGAVFLVNLSLFFWPSIVANCEKGEVFFFLLGPSPHAQ